MQFMIMYRVVFCDEICIQNRTKFDKILEFYCITILDHVIVYACYVQSFSIT